MIRTRNFSRRNTRLARAGEKRYPGRKVRIHLKSFMFVGWLAALGGAAGCVGGPKEAADPHQILGDDLAPGGVESTGASSPRPDPTAPPNAAHKPPPEPPATREECRRAARHVEEVGIDLAIDAETDPAKKKKMAADKGDTLASPEMKEHIQRGTEQCLQRGTTRREARCIAQIREERDIDRCVH